MFALYDPNITDLLQGEPGNTPKFSAGGRAAEKTAFGLQKL